MREYEVEINSETYTVNAGTLHAALRTAMIKYEVMLKEQGYRSKVGEYVSISIERKK